MARLPVALTGTCLVAIAISGCAIEDDAAPLDPELAHEHDEGCGDAMTDHALYQAMPRVMVAPDTFSLTVLDVGQGDAAVVRTPSGCAALFDGGPAGAGDVIKANLASLGITQIDVAFLSHYHADHLGSLDDVELGADGVPIGVVYDRGGSYTTQAYTTYATQYAGRRVTASLGQVVNLCDEVTMTVVAVGGNGTGTTHENGRSVVVKISYGAFDALIGGDLTGSSPDIESLMAPAVGEIEAYRVHHHGSDTSSNTTLIDTTRPLASFISLGANNTFGHPAPATLDTLAAVGSDVWLTEDPATGTLRGHIVVVSETGATFDVIQGGTTTTYTSKGVAPPVDDTTAPTPCDVEITSLAWYAGRHEVAVQGTVSESSDIQLLADGRLVGSLTASGDFALAMSAAARPSCIEVAAACGDVERACFVARSAAPADPTPALATDR